MDVVVVYLPQAPEYDPQKRLSCAWKADGLIIVGSWVLLVISMVDWVGNGWMWVGLGTVVGMHEEQGQVGLVACRQLPEYFPSEK